MIFAKNFARNYEKKIMLGTLDAWSMSHLSHRPSDPAYYIEDCRIFVFLYKLLVLILAIGRNRLFIIDFTLFLS